MPGARRANLVVVPVAAANSEKTTLIDLNKIRDPKGHYTLKVDGLTVRWAADGIHVTEAGGEWLQPQILPEVAQIGLEVRSKRKAAG